ncbi:MAG: sigma-54 dependent transcriptional regulator [Acidobacteriota bacterium]|nr:sigma-54 dependent transcriptional regulator [Acidobacteriota bacterium]
MTATVSQWPVFLGMTAVVASRTMRELLAFVQRVAQTNATVLISGESGSGKEVVARAVHHHSLRCNKPWVDVSCAALPEHLMESELFGYEKGAFSGADSPKPGLFELADHGTLFLDEVGELEPRMQVKLLRVLDGAPYYRLGGVRKVSVDVRVIAATNQPLEELCRAGKFRGDLYHRLSQIAVCVPPLRERLDDIPPLAELFLRQQNPSATLSSCAVEALLAHSWTGNVRELRNVITRAAVLAPGLDIRRSDLSPEMQRPRLNGVAAATESSDSNLEGMEKRMILDVLNRTKGHHQQAAELLGISRRTLSRKLKLYGMEAASQSA